MEPSMIEPVIHFLISILFPKAPEWLAPFLSAQVVQTIETVEDLEDADELTGDEKRAYVVDVIGEWLETLLVYLPIDLSPEAAERIIEGNSELALFIWRNLDAGVTKKQMRRAIRKAARDLGEE